MELRQDRYNPILLDEYHEAHSILKETVKPKKRDSWKKFALGLSPSVPTSKVWKKMRGMDGRSQVALPRVAIMEGEKILTSDSQKAETTVRFYAGTSRLKVPRDQEKTAYEALRVHLKIRSLTPPFDEHF